MASLRLLGLLVGLLAALPAGAAERVNVRIGEHPGFSRLVFDWPGAPKVQLERKPGRAILQFDRPGELDLARFRADPPPDVSDVAADARDGRLRVTVTFARAADLRLSRYRGDVVLDVLHQGTQPDAPPATREDGRRRRAAQGRDRATPPAPAAAPVPPRKPAAQGAPAAPGTEESAADARMGGPLSILPRETPGGAGAASAPPRSGRPAAPVRVETNRPAAQGPSPDPGTRDGEPGPRASAVPPDGSSRRPRRAR